MNKITITTIKKIFFLCFFFYSNFSHAMMTCNGNDFEYDEYKNGTILCRSPNLTCSYKAQSEWDWWATGVTYSVGSAVCGVILDRMLAHNIPQRCLKKLCGCFCRSTEEEARHLIIRDPDINNANDYEMKSFTSIK